MGKPISFRSNGEEFICSWGGRQASQSGAGGKISCYLSPSVQLSSVRLSELGCGEGWAAGDVRLGFPDEDILVFH